MINRAVLTGTLLLLAAAVCTAAMAQEVRLYVPADSVQVGEPFHLSLVARYPTDLDLVVPVAGEAEPAQLGDFELHRLIDRHVDQHNGILRDSLVFEARTFALDTARAAGADLSFVGSGDTTLIALPSVELSVAATYREGESPRDLAPIVEIPPLIWPWILAGLLVLLAAGLFIRYRRRHRHADGDEAMESLSPIEQARRRLVALEGQPRSPGLQQKQYVIELSDILRTYIARRLQLPAREQTTREILLDLQRRGIGEDARRNARNLLNLSDRIKFARAEATAEILLDAHRGASAWIEELERSLQRASSQESHSAVSSE